MYPNVTKLATANSAYNCHSYAWYSQTTTNPYWMNDPSKYWKDGSYTLVKGGPATSQKMTYLTRGLLTHSAIVTTIKQGASQAYYYYADLVTATSKWGAYGLYRHRGDDSPYWVSNTTVNYYKK